MHFSDGPIDLILKAEGEPEAVIAAEQAAARCFLTILDDLCRELPLLRQPPHPDAPPAGIVARRMWQAVRPFAAETFITPMAAVAGAVAEEVLAAMTKAAPLSRAYVNNGGDIALHLAPGESSRIGLIDRPDWPSLTGFASIEAASEIKGIATSGWRGRSFSLGIADAVTVLASEASLADAAATIIANAVDLPGHPGIARVPAKSLQPENDLGERLVTRAVPHLTSSEIATALEAGATSALRLMQRLPAIRAAALQCQGQRLIVDPQRLL